MSVVLKELMQKLFHYLPFSFEIPLSTRKRDAASGRGAARRAFWRLPRYQHRFKRWCQHDMVGCVLDAHQPSPRRNSWPEARRLAHLSQPGDRLLVHVPRHGIRRPRARQIHPDRYVEAVDAVLLLGLAVHGSSTQFLHSAIDRAEEAVRHGADEGTREARARLRGNARSRCHDAKGHWTEADAPSV